MSAQTESQKSEATDKPANPSRLSLNLPLRQGEELDDMARQTGLTKNELLRQAVALLSLTVKARRRGLHLALAEDDSDRVKERVVSTI